MGRRWVGTLIFEYRLYNLISQQKPIKTNPVANMQYITPEDWKEKGSYFNYISHKVFYREANEVPEDAPVLLLLHGFPTASWDWYKIWDSLSQKFRVFAPDFLGFGFSDKPREYQYSILDQADMVELLLQKKKVCKVHLLAHDYGDTVAQELLARHQDRVQFKEDGVLLHSITLLNGGLFPEVHHPKPIQRLLLGPFGKYVAKFLTEKKFRENMTSIFGKDYPPTNKELNAFWQLVNYNHGQQVTHKLMHYMKERKTYRTRWVESLQKTKVPIRFIDGLQDTISGMDMANRYKELIDNPDVIELPDAGHYPQIEQPEEVLKHFFEFHCRLEGV